MFPLLAIAAFFILGIAFFAIGKDDFGIKRLKDDSIDTFSRDNMVTNLEMRSNNESTEGDSESKDPLKDNQVTANTSD